MKPTPKQVAKRTVDMRIIGDWVEPRSRVVDLGCGRGELLVYLVQTKQASAVGIDLDFENITECALRGVPAHQGDMAAFLRAFPDGHFDRVICSRTVHELNDPAGVILEALRAGRSVIIGFVNYGYWKNRVYPLLRGRKVRNAVYPTAWSDSRPANPVTIADFEDFCRSKQIRILRRAHLLGDWKTPCRFLPNLLAGYAFYDLTKQ